MAPSGAFPSRDTLAALPEPAFAALQGRRPWGAATRVADRVLEASPAAATEADLDALAEAHGYTKQSRYVTGALQRIGDRAESGAAAVFRDAYFARAAAADPSITTDVVAALIGRVAGCGVLVGGDSIEAACARLALAGHLGVGDLSVAEAGLLAALRDVLDDEGAHRSGSAGPHAVVHGMLSAVLESRLTEHPELVRLRYRMEEILAWLVAPDGTLAEVGETPPLVIGGVWTGNAGPVRMKAFYRHPALLHASTAGALGIAPGRGWRVIPGAGIAIVKRGWPDSLDARADSDHLVLLGPNRSRQDDDALSLTWFTEGRWILIESGHLPDDNGRYRPDQEIAAGESAGRVPDPQALADHFATASAHNTVLFPGLAAPLEEGGFVRWGEIRGIPFFDAVAAGSGVEHRRSVAMGDDWLLVADRVAAPDAMASECRFHSPGALDLIPREGAYLLSAEGSPAVWVRHLGSQPNPTDPVRGATRGAPAGWKASAGRPVPAWEYGFSHRGAFEAATLFTCRAPSRERPTGPGEYSWEAGGRPVEVRLDAIGIADIEEGASS